MEDDNTFEFLVLAGIAGLILLPILTKIKTSLNNFYNSVIAFTQSHVFHIILTILTIILILFIIYFIYLKIKEKFKRSMERKSEVKKLREDVMRYINENLSYYNSEEIYEFVLKLKKLKDKVITYDELLDLINPIGNKLFSAVDMHDVALKDERNELAEKRKDEIKEETKEAKDEKYRESLAVKEMDGVIYRRLDAEHKEVFILSRLKVEERKALLRQYFNQSNQYFPDKNINIPVLVKKIMNHSDEHTFLVWYVKKLLKTFKGVTNIEGHETKIADITFKYKNRYYAIEVETGSLSRHKKRLEIKINYLNSKHKNRWFFLVSNKNLLRYYKRFGPTTQRSQVTKMIERTLQIDHPDISGGDEYLSNIKY